MLFQAPDVLITSINLDGIIHVSEWRFIQYIATFDQCQIVKIPFKGMAVFIPVFGKLLSKKYSAKDIHNYLSSYYDSERFVRVEPFDSSAQLDNGFFNPLEANDTNRNDIFILGDDRQILLVSRLDNLGKGASGAAVQNMNIMLGLDEGAGLD